LAGDVRDADVVIAAADPHGGLENGHLPASGVFEEVGSVRRLVGAGDDEVEIAVAVVVHRQRPRPEADAEIDDEAGVVVRKPCKVVGAAG
jgi:hypothetical protein